MVHIFAAEGELFGPVQALVQVLTSATLALFQQGKKNKGASFCKDSGQTLLVVWDSVLIYSLLIIDLRVQAPETILISRTHSCSCTPRCAPST